MSNKRKHDDTTVKLDMTFDEAMAKLAQAKRKDSQAEESGNTTEPARESEPSTEQTVPDREARDD